MLDWLARQLDVSTNVAAILLAFIVVQLAVQVYAVVDLARRESVRGGRKWVWALVIVFGNLVGAIVYLASGRATQEVDVAGPAIASGGEAARRAANVLYGARDRR